MTAHPRFSSLTPRTTALRRQAQTIADELEKHVMAGSSTATGQTNRTIAISLSVTGLALALAIGLAFVLAQFSIVAPLRALTGAMGELAKGNFDVVLPGLGRKDEVGEIAQAVEDFKVKAEEKAKLGVKRGRWAGVVQDLDSGKFYYLRDAACSLPRCHCDALIVSVEEE